MQARVLFLLPLLPLLTASALAQSRNATLVINGAALIDGTGGPSVPDALVVISGDRIALARRSGGGSSDPG